MTVSALTVALFSPSFLRAQAARDVHGIAEGVDNHYNRLKTLQAEFIEIYRGNGLDRVENGTLWLKKPRKMRWEYRSPREKLFVSDGKDAWFYVPEERQARKEPFQKLEDLRSPLGFLLGKTKLEKELQGLSKATDLTPSTPGNVILRGIPKGLDGRINQVLLEIDGENRISRIVLEEADGAITEYRFTDQKEDVPVSDKSFEFSPPPGVETIETEIGP
jgi:outer membrane lipoprotein carrier protein